MSTIVLDADLRAKLNGLNEMVNVQDEGGTLVGRFVPEEQYRHMQDYYRLLCRNVEIPFSKEEIERRRKETGGIPLAEFWQKMGVQ